MKKWSVLSRIVFSFALLTAVMVGRSVMTHISLSAMQREAEEVREAASSGMSIC